MHRLISNIIDIGITFFVTLFVCSDGFSQGKTGEQPDAAAETEHNWTDTVIGPWNVRIHAPEPGEHPGIWEGPVEIGKKKGEFTCSVDTSLIKGLRMGPRENTLIIEVFSGSNSSDVTIDVDSCRVSKDSRLQTVKSSATEVKQYVSEDYVVVEKAFHGKSGSDFYVLKMKGNGGSAKRNDTLFTLKNQENCFFVNMFLDLLFMDYGTGPDSRILRVYDVGDGKKILDTLYTGSIDKVGNDSVAIWLEGGDTALSKCPEYRKWEEHGLGAAIIVEHYFDLKKLKLFKTERWKCYPRQ